MSIKKWSTALLLLVGLCPMVFGWEGQNGFSICTATGNQMSSVIAPDGRGGAIITWSDYRNGANWDVYAQGIDNTGDVRWDTNGILIAGGVGSQYQPQIVRDNNNGAYIIWTNYINEYQSDIYLQKINYAGDLQYSAGGMSICTSDGTQMNTQIAEDGAGGVVIAWCDYSKTDDIDIYTQAVSWENNLLYPENGVAICTAAGNQNALKIIADGQGGSIIVWTDYRNGDMDKNIYAQAVDGSGAVRWTLDGVAISTAVNNQIEPQIVTDGQGGAIICWTSEIGSIYQIMAQAIDSTGQVKWAENGVSVCSTDYNQDPPVMVSDGLGGAIIVWGDFRNSSTGIDLYAQAIDSTGTPCWDASGLAICTTDYTQFNYQVISDGSNGAIICWADYRNGINSNIYTQAVSNTGIVKWAQNGIVLSATSKDQYEPIMTSDETGGAIIAWNDSRNSNYDIYAQSVTGTGLVPVELSEFSIE